jgi:DinB superfamily
METSEQYKTRILKLMEGKDAVQVQRETVPRLTQLVRGVAADKLARRPAPEKWSVSEILIHMADAEVASAWRYRQMIEHNGAPIQSFDQDLWYQLGDYASRDPRESLEQFRLLREANLRMLEKLTPEQWKLGGVHVERGPMSVANLVRQMAGHDINHLAQIEKMVGAETGALA